mmetsp:Transcript_39828/g.95839  ORF Transcript_39828/g.95839 Transcript_39828/m.95839 type:complete len:210 (+) Transcript_39828:2285-2914(+)
MMREGEAAATPRPGTATPTPYPPKTDPPPSLMEEEEVRISRPPHRSPSSHRGAASSPTSPRRARQRPTAPPDPARVAATTTTPPRTSPSPDPARAASLGLTAIPTRTWARRPRMGEGVVTGTTAPLPAARAATAAADYASPREPCTPAPRKERAAPRRTRHDSPSTTAPGRRTSRPISRSFIITITGRRAAAVTTTTRTRPTSSLPPSF